MYATSLPPRPNPYARTAENYAPRFSPDELPLLPVNWVPSWRSPPSKIWGDAAGVKGGENRATTAATSYVSESAAAARPRTTGSIGFVRDSSAREMWGTLRDNCTGRLHAVQTHNISDRSIDSGLIPPHLLDGSVPPPQGKRATSLDYFPPCVRPATVPAIRMGHQYSRLIRDTPAKRLEAYKRGAVLRDGPVRIVRHTSKDRTFMKKSAHRNPRGISRNVLGGFCTS
ncbi:unnamed protein product [Ectocarpus sp. 12 AP-2014]